MAHSFDYASFIKIGADDISKLRECDVYRLLDEYPYTDKSGIVGYITLHRPDLTEECEEVQAQIDQG